MKKFVLFSLLLTNPIALIFCMEKKRHNGQFTKNDYKQFLIIQTIYDLFYQLKAENDLFNCNKKLTIEPFKNRMQSAYCLEFSYGTPFALLTPLGKLIMRSFWQSKKCEASIIDESLIASF